MRVTFASNFAGFLAPTFYQLSACCRSFWQLPLERYVFVDPSPCSCISIHTLQLKTLRCHCPACNSALKTCCFKTPAVEGISSIERLPYVNSILQAMLTSSVSHVWLYRKTKNLSRSLKPCSEISLISVTISILRKTAKIFGKSCQVSQKDFLSFPATDGVVSHSLIA